MDYTVNNDVKFKLRDIFSAVGNLFKDNSATESNLDKQVEEIRKQETKGVISTLESKVGKANIPLEDKKEVVKKVKTSGKILIKEVGEEEKETEKGIDISL